MDEQHPGGEERGQEDIEVEGAGVDVGEEIDEQEGTENDGGEEAGAVVVVEAVAGFERIGVVRERGRPGCGRPGCGRPVNGRRRRSSRRRRTSPQVRSRGG
jgi:hypothetical protein